MEIRSPISSYKAPYSLNGLNDCWDLLLIGLTCLICDFFPEQLSHLYFQGQLANQLLEGIGPIETVDTVSSNNSVLYLHILGITT